jgi:hypothetical protein
VVSEDAAEAFRKYDAFPNAAVQHCCSGSCTAFADSAVYWKGDRNNAWYEDRNVVLDASYMPLLVAAFDEVDTQRLYCLNHERP